MASNAQQQAVQPAGFWKIRHAVIALGVLLIVGFALVRGCGGDAEIEVVEAAQHNSLPRQAVAVQIPAPQWPGAHYRPVPQPSPVPGYVPQAPAYGYPQQPPAQSFPQQPPAYGYPVQPPVAQTPQYPAADPDNPWAVQPPTYGYDAQAGRAAASQQPWGRPPRQQPVYSHNRGNGQYRPLEEGGRGAQTQQRSALPSPAAVWPRAPYDRLAGSSFGVPNSGWGGYPYTGAYPGYYGGMPYGMPGGYGGWPGGFAYPGVGWPGGW